MVAKSWIKGQNKVKTITKSTFIPWMHDKDASETAVGNIVLLKKPVVVGLLALYVKSLDNHRKLHGG